MKAIHSVMGVRCDFCENDAAYSVGELLDFEAPKLCKGCAVKFILIGIESYHNTRDE